MCTPHWEHRVLTTGHQRSPSINVFNILFSSKLHKGKDFFLFNIICFSSLQFSSVAKPCPTLCDPMDCSTPGLRVHHQLSEFTQTHVHRVGDAIQPSHPLLSPSAPTFTLSQHQSLFKWVSSSHQVGKVLEFQLQHQSFQWIFKTDFLAVQGTLKSLLQHHSSEATIHWCSASLVAQMVKHLSTMQETWVRSLGQEVPWRRKRQPTPVLLPRKSHGRRSLVSMGSQRVGHDWATSLFFQLSL